ncbi:MAG: glycosyltransferase family 4 protein [Desulfomonilaceae bacterium]|nr:glycosyltransferase family 4 protein [Desulfomonilaceae bacterium]
MTSTRIRLALLLQDLEFGGTQRYAINLLKHLDRTRFDPELWVLRGGDDMVPLAEATGTKIVRFTEGPYPGPTAVYRLLLHLVSSRPQILYTLTVVPNIWGRIFGTLTRVPVVIASLRNRVAGQYDRWLWRLCDRMVVNAESLRDLLAKDFAVDRNRIDVIPNGVDTDYFTPDLPQRSTHPSLIYVGRLVEQKDPLTLLKAFRLVVDDLPQARLVMVGNGDLRPAIDEFVRSHSLGSRVQVLNGTKDIRRYLQKSWAFVLPSVFEGSPNVVIEAMACGLPIVSTRVDGVPELVRDYETGFMVEPQNAEALAEAMIKVLSDDEKCRAMGSRAREKAAAEFSIETMARMTEQVFLDAAKRARIG